MLLLLYLAYFHNSISSVFLKNQLVMELVMSNSIVFLPTIYFMIYSREGGGEGAEAYWPPIYQ